MEISRRSFLKASGATLGGLFLFNGVNNNAVMARSLKKVPLKEKVKESTTICCYCSVGCGAIVSVYEDGILKIEGDPDHPINEGT
ncbi:MAG: twin-arginine translocation signal domain-containing protein, partial [Dehalococcoidales bacterium]|nr:twin-arginine translocation signal domain-containing protein [Dehalococcoidales bacterium]